MTGAHAGYFQRNLYLGKAGSTVFGCEDTKGLRTHSLTVPGARVPGLSVTSFFCGAVDHASVAMNGVLIHPAPFFVLVGLVVVAGADTARRTGAGARRTADPAVA